MLNQNVKSAPVNVFMAVPTIYAKLIEMYKLEGGLNCLTVSDLEDIVEPECQVSPS